MSTLRDEFIQKTWRELGMTVWPQSPLGTTDGVSGDRADDGAGRDGLDLPSL